MASASERSGLNAGYVGVLREQYLDNPESVDPAWRAIFERADDSALAPVPSPAAAPTIEVSAAEQENGGAAIATLAPPVTAQAEEPAEIDLAEPSDHVAEAPAPAIDTEVLAAVASA